MKLYRQAKRSHRRKLTDAPEEFGHHRAERSLEALKHHRELSRPGTQLRRTQPRR
jgi:hypothetical protein